MVFGLQCVGKYAVLRPSSVEEEASTFVPKPVKDNKRKRPSASEDPKSKTGTNRKLRKSTIPLTAESVLRLRDEDNDKEENDGSVLEARMKKSIDAPKAAESMTVGTSEGAGPEALRTEENAPSESLGAIVIGDSSTLPAFSEGDIREAQVLGALEMSRSHKGEDPFRDLFTSVEDAAGRSDVSGFLWEVQLAVNRALAVHREAYSRSRAELHRFEIDLRRVTEERNALKLLFGQRKEEIKGLRAELAKAHQDQTDLTEQVMLILRTHGLDSGLKANISVSQLQQKLETIGQLREEVDTIRAETMGWKDGMDRLATEKETIRAQLSSTVSQLQGMKEKSLVQARRIEELEARLASELAKAKSDAEKAKSYADALVAVYRADTEAAQVQAREAVETANTRAHWVAELAKCRSRRETLEEIHAWGFDLTEEIKSSKELEADAEALASDDDDDDDDDDDGSKIGEEPDGDKTAPGDNQ
ncbi:uncharacterized protein [Nicotiana tomentosiformis]|uniref:uncharacterized protein n=1 Tax=Nicotiana tomentosiformis TaxID=4098 RepID=UPI00388CDBE8